MLGSISNAVGLIALMPYVQPSSAVSPEAETVKQVVGDLVRTAEQSVALFGDRATAISRLHEVAEECALDDWDGCGALAVDREAVSQAERFLRTLPSGFPMPECSPEPDGAISLDWSAAKNRLFSISIGRGNRLAFAWLDGSDKGHGVARFDGVSTPARILDGLRLILVQSHAAIRAS